MIYFIALCFELWKAQRKHAGPHYITVEKRGVPFLAVLYARDREAWRISQYTIEHLSMK